MAADKEGNKVGPTGPAAARVAAMLHPARARILAALHRSDLSAAALGAALPDLPTGSLYRHLGVLEAAGLVRVAAHERGKRRSQRVYGIVQAAALLGPEERKALDRSTIPALVADLAEIVKAAACDYAAGLEGSMPDGEATFVLKHVVVSEREWSEFRAHLRRLVDTAGRRPGPGLERRLLAAFGFPA